MGRYDDIIDLPHPVSLRHPQMSMKDRAAQFASFKALSGYEDEIAEAGRLTEHRIELEEDEKDLLDRQLQQIAAHPGAAVSITWFQPDEHKEGGSCLTVCGRIRRVDPLRRSILLIPSGPVHADGDSRDTAFSPEDRSCPPCSPAGNSSEVLMEIPVDDILAISLQPQDPESF